jgi:hypothetical protein
LSFKKSGALTLIALILLLAGLAALALRLRSSNILARNPPTPTPSRMKAFPKTFLWAWERPEELEFINPREVGVAFLAETIYLRGDKVIERPRLQPLKVPQGTTLIAVVRIESTHDTQPVLSGRQRALVAEALNQNARRPNVAALQIDFDAAQSERKFYSELLQDVRGRLPDSMPLTMTALASWCIFDNWIDDLPVDEAVPMFFQMGIDQQRIANYLHTGGEVRSTLCQESIGISTDETIAPLSSTKRVYIFNPQPWSELTVRRAFERNRNEKLVP